ncbi:hypothetical protein KIPB_001374 [Kipferlia bialata]|uniref:Uncharacterized protein n=1 Tax=Kipferlia bialata TaxID=797122 RepID=A0A9K3CQG1_9EUKA|nr:hypothetical protein KIPB_001374 [Kipferlia bialata]|eukprot:g1374.t1
MVPASTVQLEHALHRLRADVGGENVITLNGRRMRLKLSARPTSRTASVLVSPTERRARLADKYLAELQGRLLYRMLSSLYGRQLVPLNSILTGVTQDVPFYPSPVVTGYIYSYVPFYPPPVVTGLTHQGRSRPTENPLIREISARAKLADAYLNSSGGGKHLRQSLHVVQAQCDSEAQRVRGDEELQDVGMSTHALDIGGIMPRVSGISSTHYKTPRSTAVMFDGRVLPRSLTSVLPKMVRTAVIEPCASLCAMPSQALQLSLSLGLFPDGDDMHREKAKAESREREREREPEEDSEGSEPSVKCTRLSAVHGGSLLAAAQRRSESLRLRKQYSKVVRHKGGEVEEISGSADTAAVQSLVKSIGDIGGNHAESVLKGATYAGSVLQFIRAEGEREKEKAAERERSQSKASKAKRGHSSSASANTMPRVKVEQAPAKLIVEVEQGPAKLRGPAFISGVARLGHAASMLTSVSGSARRDTSPEDSFPSTQAMSQTVSTILSSPFRRGTDVSGVIAASERRRQIRVRGTAARVGRGRERLGRHRGTEVWRPIALGK